MTRILGDDGMFNRLGILGRSDLVESPGQAPGCPVCGHTSGACLGEADQAAFDAISLDPDRLVPAPSVVVADDGTIVARPGEMIPAVVAEQAAQD